VDVCLVQCLCCQRSLRRADPSSRGVIPDCGVCLSVMK
jgi:hypothetical protein